MSLISRAAFEVDDYWRIVEILHNRLLRFDRKNWRVSYKALILLEHLLTHGPESIAEEFQSNRDVILEMESFQYIDERGFNWGLTVRKKSERILNLLEKGTLKEERDRARKLTRGIEGFGSFSQRASSVEGRESSFGTFARCNSHYNEHGDQEDALSALKEEGSMDSVSVKKKWNSTCSFSTDQILEKPNKQTSHKENMTPSNELLTGDLNEWNCTRDVKPLLDDQRDEPKIRYSIEEDLPLRDTEHQSTESLLLTRH